MLWYVYVDLETQRVFRGVPYDHRFIPAILDGVMGMVMPSDQYSPEKTFGWSKYKGLFSESNSLPDDKKQRLEVLKSRCEALEYLYRVLYLLRRQQTGSILGDEAVFQYKVQEAKSYQETRELEPEGFLGDFALFHDLTLAEASRMVLFLEEDRKNSLQQSERLRLKWEKVFKTAENPEKELNEFKNTVYVG